MERPDKSKQAWVVLASFASLVLVGYVDYITDVDLHFQVFYFIPVALCAWCLRRREVIAMAVLGALTWGYVDRASGHAYRHWSFWGWNTGVCLATLLILGLVLQRLRQNLKEQQRARQELEKALADLRHSTAETQKLQSQLQVICAWTNRIQIEGKWMKFEEFMQKHLNVRLTHGISPEAMEKFARELEKRDAEQKSPSGDSAPAGHAGVPHK